MLAVVLRVKSTIWWNTVELLSQLHAGGTILVGFLTQCCKLCHLFIIVLLLFGWWLVYFVEMQWPSWRKKENNYTEPSVHLHIVHFKTVESFRKTQKVYWLHPTHKPAFLSEKASCNRTSTKDIVERFFNRDNAYSRRQRVCDLMSQLTDQELVEFTLPRVVDIVPPIDLFFFGKEAHTQFKTFSTT